MVVVDVPGDAPARWDRDTALTVLYTAHHRSLVRIAGLLLRDVDAAEDVVQDAFVGLYRRWYRLRDPDKAAAYLRQATVNGARSALRRRGTARRALPRLLPTATDPDVAAQVTARHTVTDALARLPERQREVLVLRYYADLSEAQIADTLGISRGAVKTHASRGLAALRPSLELVR
ncbi:MAG: SigE family RNA polymerase sigma factor [Actinomycetia bacterium]|nr:SigE family RNA polymerase sigma factor [Actinomycetes bacterium]